MSRSTQYIGLTGAADEYILSGGQELNNLKILENKYNDKDIYWEKRFANGMMDDELVPLATWRREFQGREVLIREVVQVSPWSSGPMIFTCLEIDFGNGNKWDQPGDAKYDQTSVAMCFQWIDDPTVENEYDPHTGRMWV